jgi:signal transduction histidine kinase
MLLRAALGLALFETLVLAGVLLAWADRVAGGRVLAAFLAGIAVWIAGNELPNWFGAPAAPLALRLLATAPFTSVLFFHFCVVFCRVPLSRTWLWAAYAVGGTGSAVALALVPAHWVQHPVVGWLAVAEFAGVIASLAWVVMAVAGVTVLLRAWASARPPARQQIAAVTASCLWGLICLAGYAIALADWPIYPFPLLGLPLYPVILVYGILRYGVFVANAWAGRALAWTLLLAVGLGVVGVMPLLLPFESRWINGLAVAAACLALTGPVRRVAHRLIYPGGDVTAADLAAWRVQLRAPDTLDELVRMASQQLSQRLGTPVLVSWGSPEASTSSAQPGLGLRLQSGKEGWSVQWQGWEAAPPGQRHVVDLYGSLLVEAAERVGRAQALASRERERQLQARLAELGSLAATVAHDIRNPLNIIGMAVALAPTDTRQEVQTQVSRIAHLADDLLDYAKPWSVQPEPYDLAAQLRALAQRTPRVRVGPALAAQPALTCVADARRIEQALVNLLENARTASAGAEAGPVELELTVADNTAQVHVCDNGPGVPADLRDRVFEPFASRSKGGTGLGLAIVARIAQAHGGRVALTERPPWRTCFTLSLPLP